MGADISVLALALTAMQPAEPALVPLGIIENEGGTRLCLPDRAVCFGLSEPQSGVVRELVVYRGDAGAPDRRLPIPYGADNDESLTLLPMVVNFAWDLENSPASQAILIGVLSRRSTIYSGGGGESQRLHLRQISWGQGLPFMDQGEVLSLPWHTSLMIRACFSEADTDRRRGACHDEYSYAATLTLAPDDDRSSEWPALLYTTQATAYPQTARRSEDSSDTRALRTSDLSHWRDPECSYTRTLRYNPATERYEMDRPAPDCTDYTVP